MAKNVLRAIILNCRASINNKSDRFNELSSAKAPYFEKMMG